MIYLEKNDIHSTLTTWIYCHFWMMCSLERQGKRCYINWPEGKSLKSYYDKNKFEEKPNMYDWYFKQPHTFDPLQEIGTTLTWETWQDPLPVPFMSQPLQVIKDYYKSRLIFSDEVNARGQAIVGKYGIDFKETIGITWRGTDVYLDGRPRIPIEKYYKWIDQILEQHPDMVIMCTAEEETILDPLLKRYPNSFIIEEFVSSPFQSKHNPERIDNRSGFERGLQPALMVWLFSKCAHYIKNRSSAAAVASWLSSGRIVNIAHEETLSYVKMDDRVEIEGIKYPL